MKHFIGDMSYDQQYTYTSKDDCWPKDVFFFFLHASKETDWHHRHHHHQHPHDNT